MRPIVLTGLPASGKTTLARALAHKLNGTVVDTDETLASEFAMPIADVFQTLGEARFREREQQLVHQWLGTAEHREPHVISVGGGTLLHTATRHRVLKHAWLIALQAPLETLVQRLHNSHTRPLVAHDPAARLAQLREQRAPLYAEAHHTLNTHLRPIDALVDELMRVVQQLERHDVLVMPLGASTYSITLGNDLSLDIVPAFLQPVDQWIQVTDRIVQRALARNTSPPSLVKALAHHVPTHATTSLEGRGDREKSLANTQRIWTHALAQHASRRSVLCATGGGVVGDLTGFAAATLLRGVRHVMVPTTLLAMVDASVGGKTGIDFAFAKNLIGAFHQPRWVACDLQTLRTLSPLHLRAGMAEIAKIGLACNDTLALQLEALEPVRWPSRPGQLPTWIEPLIAPAIQTKIDIVALDEHDTADRERLNFGHTIGHAIESALNYTVAHGLCIALGMRAEINLAVQLGLTTHTLAQRAHALLNHLAMPLTITQISKRRPNARRAQQALASDKKRGPSGSRMVILSAMGHSELVSVSHEILLQATLSSLGIG